MEPFKPLSGFFETAKSDGRITISHIGLYAVLLQAWQDQGFQNPVMAFSHEIMALAKMSARATYFKCLNDLNDRGYIRYERCFKRNVRSKIYLRFNGDNDKSESDECRNYNQRGFTGF